MPPHSKAEKWKTVHTDATGHTEFTVTSAPFPEGRESDPDWVEVTTCTVCHQTEPYGRSATDG